MVLVIEILIISNLELSLIFVKPPKSWMNQNYTPLSNGIRVMSDGTIVQKDGTKSMLEEGQCLNKAGERVPMGN